MLDKIRLDEAVELAIEASDFSSDKALMYIEGYMEALNIDIEPIKEYAESKSSKLEDIERSYVKAINGYQQISAMRKIRKSDVKKVYREIYRYLLAEDEFAE